MFVQNNLANLLEGLESVFNAIVAAFEGGKHSTVRKPNHHFSSHLALDSINFNRDLKKRDAELNSLHLDGKFSESLENLCYVEREGRFELTAHGLDYKGRHQTDISCA